MSRVIAQSIFSETTQKRSWQSYVASGAVHVVVISALFLVTFPAVEKIAQPDEHVTLVDPVLPAYKPKTIAQPVIRQKVFLKEPVKPVLPPKRFIPPPVVKPPEVKHVEMAKAPEIKAPIAPVKVPEIKMEAPAPPKPIVKTGVFESQQLAQGPKLPNQLKVGGFGDPNGAHPSDNAQPSRLTVARVGGFDMPQGAGQGGGGGHSQVGGVRAAGFGSMGDPSGVPGGTGVHGSVRTGGFGDGTAAAPAQLALTTPSKPATTPVEILFKPKPAYTPEARQLGLEGQVSLEVQFAANGAVRVVRVVRGLGHGLDEAAEQAAAQVRFRPATRDGVPVDTNATIYITFQIS